MSNLDTLTTVIQKRYPFIIGCVESAFHTFNGRIELPLLIYEISRSQYCKFYNIPRAKIEKGGKEMLVCNISPEYLNFNGDCEFHRYVETAISCLSMENELICVDPESIFFRAILCP